MKKIFLIIIILYGCGPELQSVIHRDEFNRVVLEGELKGESDTLWTHIYTYHPLKLAENSSLVDTAENISVDDDGGLVWGEEPPSPSPSDTLPIVDANISQLDSLQIPIDIDTVRASLSIFTKTKPDGEWKTWYPNGILKTTSHYSKGILSGGFSYYDSTGVLIQIDTYIKGKKNGLSTFFVDGEIIIHEKTFKNDSLDGAWTTWHSNGSREVIRLFKKGKPIGNWIFSNRGGEWTREEQYKKGIAHGIWTFLDSAGVKAHQYYTNGKLLAEYKETKWANGQLMEIPSFKNGLPHGTWTGYWANGKTRYSLNYKNGEKNGKEIRYDSTGVILLKISYTKGLKEGIAIEYYKNGKIKRSAKYKKGQLNGKTKLFNNFGIKTETITYKDSLRNGNHIYWFQNGQRYKQFEFINDELNGEFGEWDSLGLNIVNGFYYDGHRHNKWLYFDTKGRRDKYIFLDMDSINTDYIFNYYPNWQIKEEPSFNNDGLFDGNWKSFYQSGELLKKYGYKNGLKNGVWLSYHEDNRLNNYKYFNSDSLVTDYNYQYYKNLQIKEMPNFSENGLYDKKWISFFNNGKTWKTYHYNNGIKSSIWTVFRDSTYNTHTETMYGDDKRNGSYFEWYLNNNPKEEGSYKNDKKDLLWTYWNEFGERRFEEWNNGELNDTFEFEYYQNGQVKEEPSYENGKKHGEWVRYFPDGTVGGTRSYKEGLKDGIWIDYYRSEQIAFEGKYKADYRTGEWNWYWLNRTLMNKSIYDNGNPTFEECYDRTTGNIRDCSKVVIPSDF
jgi:antitoxin component YwqK of YwqJK toxin-antitoxin module